MQKRKFCDFDFAKQFADWRHSSFKIINFSHELAMGRGFDTGKPERSA
jgi:hypothetical protein